MDGLILILDNKDIFRIVSLLSLISLNLSSNQTMTIKNYHFPDMEVYHIPEMEFSAFFDKTTNVQGDRVIYLKYLLFIKYKNNIYIDVKNVGSIVMPFEEMLKNHKLKMYYDLSLLFVKDKNKIVEKLSEDGSQIWDAEITDIYKGLRNWYVDCAYILNDEVKTDKQYCYYEMSPFELSDPYSLWIDDITGDRKWVHTASEIEFFNYNFQTNVGHVLAGVYKKRVINYTNIAIAYNVSLMEKELDEISAIEEDKRNLINLIAFYEKKDMNGDLFDVIYNNLIRAPDTFAPYLENLEDAENTIRTLILAT